MAVTVEEIRSNPQFVRRAVWLAGILGGMQTADPVVASLALPNAGKGLGFGAGELAIAASISTLVLAATVVPLGAFADRVGRRKLLIILVLLAIVGDLLVVVAPTGVVFMLGRALAGASVGGVLAICYAMVRMVSPPDKLGINLGLWSGICGGLALPLSIFGAGLASQNWRLAFLLIPLIAICCLPFITRWLPDVPPADVRRELIGVTLAGLGVVGILFALSQTATKIVQPLTVIPLVAGVLLLLVAAIVGLRAKRPAYPVRIFKNPVFVVAALSGILWNCVSAVGILGSSNLWQYRFGTDPFLASLLQIPMNIATVFGMIAIGKSLARGRQPRLIILVGMLLAAGGFVLCAYKTASGLGFIFNIGLMLAGLGAGMVCTAQSALLITAATKEYLGPVAASRTTFGQIGYAIGLSGISVVTSIFTIQEIQSHTGADESSARDSLNLFLTSAHDSKSTIAQLYEHGFQSAALFFAVIFAIGGLVCLIILSLPSARRNWAAAMAETENSSADEQEEMAAIEAEIEASTRAGLR